MSLARGGIGSVTEPSRSVYKPNRRCRLAKVKYRIRTAHFGKPTVGKTEKVGRFGTKPVITDSHQIRVRDRGTTTTTMELAYKERGDEK